MITPVFKSDGSAVRERMLLNSQTDGSNPSGGMFLRLLFMSYVHLRTVVVIFLANSERKHRDETCTLKKFQNPYNNCENPNLHWVSTLSLKDTRAEEFDVVDDEDQPSVISIKE